MLGGGSEGRCIARLKTHDLGQSGGRLRRFGREFIAVPGDGPRAANTRPSRHKEVRTRWGWIRIAPRTLQNLARFKKDRASSMMCYPAARRQERMKKDHPTHTRTTKNRLGPGLQNRDLRLVNGPSPWQKGPQSRFTTRPTVCRNTVL